MSERADAGQIKLRRSGIRVLLSKLTNASALVQFDKVQGWDRLQDIFDHPAFF